MAPQNNRSVTPGAAQGSARVVDSTPGHLRKYLSLDDFQASAKRRLPRQIYGFYAGAAETEDTLLNNQRAYRDLALIPAVLRDVKSRSTEKTLFGQTYAMPVGIAPMGLAGLSTFQGDLALAGAAQSENALMVASASSLMPLEQMSSAGGVRWFQCYLPGDTDRIKAMLERVARAGYTTLVLTADVPVPGNRENNIRNGFSIPLEPSLRLLWEGISHPRWTFGAFLRTLAQGMPHFENMDAFRGPAIVSRNVVRDIGNRDQLSWNHVQFMRKHWPGNIVIKGVLNPSDAAKARDAGADGIWVSNHGGRQLDTAVAPGLMLPHIKERAGDMIVMVDSGVRRGTDVLKALALGADFVFIGRPFLFAAAAAGEPGVRRALTLIRDEINRDMALMGITRLSELTAERVTRARA